MVASHIQARGEDVKRALESLGLEFGGLEADRRVRRVLGGTGDEEGVQEGGVWI